MITTVLIATICCVCCAEAALIAFLVVKMSNETEKYFRMLSDKEGVDVMPTVPKKKTERPQTMISRQADAMDRQRIT